MGFLDHYHADDTERAQLPRKEPSAVKLILGVGAVVLGLYGAGKLHAWQKQKEWEQQEQKLLAENPGKTINEIRRDIYEKQREQEDAAQKIYADYLDRVQEQERAAKKWSDRKAVKRKYPFMFMYPGLIEASEAGLMSENERRIVQGMIDDGIYNKEYECIWKLKPCPEEPNVPTYSREIEDDTLGALVRRGARGAVEGWKNTDGTLHEKKYGALTGAAIEMVLPEADEEFKDNFHRTVQGLANGNPEEVTQSLSEMSRR